MSNLSEQIKVQAVSLLPELIEIRRHLHRHPELSFQEFKTSDFIANQLNQWGIEFKRGYAGTGIRGILRCGNADSKVIALRADIDALPIQEESGLEFSSTNPGVMHACGHDVHTTSLLGAIKILHQLKDQLNGTFLFLFQPGEEMIPGGAKKMMEDGVFQDFKPDLVIGQHILPEMDAGKTGFKPGMFMASSDEIYIRVKGTGGHAALPHLIDDTVSIAAHILVNLQQVVSRKSPAYIPSVLSFGRIEANGANNIIPDLVTMAGTFRTMNEDWRAKAKELIRSIAEQTASSMGARAEVEIRDGYPFLVNDESSTLKAIDLAKTYLGENAVEDLHLRMTAEDFAYFSQAYPSVFYRLGTRKAGSEFVPLHSSRLMIDEKSLETGSGLLAYLAISFTLK